MAQTNKVNFDKQLVYDDTNLGRQYVFTCGESTVKLSDILDRLEEFKNTLTDDHRLALSDFFHLCTKGKTFSNEKQIKSAFINGFLLGKFASRTDLGMVGTEVRLIHNTKKVPKPFDEDGDDNVCV